MNTIKVLAHTVEPVHNFYKTQFGISISNVEYVKTFDSNKTRDNFDSKKELAKVSFKSIRRKVFNKIDPFDVLKVPVLKPVSTECDLVHMAGIVPLTDKPWVVDFEELSMFAHYNSKSMYWPQFKFLFKTYFSSNNCKKILPWTEAAKKGFEYYCRKVGIGKKVTDKLEVVYPYVESKKHFKKKINQKKQLLFVGKQFYLKGGFETILAFEKLSKKIDCELTIISKIPAEIKQKYSSLKGLNLIESSAKISDKFIANCYKKADLFIFPTHLDTLGFVILEAMSYGLPIVSVTQFAVPELVTNNGLLVNNPYSDHKDFIKAYYPKSDSEYPLIGILKNPKENYVNQIAYSCEKILSNPLTLKKMSKNSFFAIEKGRFSKKERVKKLKSIYLEALK